MQSEFSILFWNNNCSICFQETDLRECNLPITFNRCWLKSVNILFKTKTFLWRSLSHSSTLNYFKVTSWCSVLKPYHLVPLKAIILSPLILIIFCKLVIPEISKCRWDETNKPSTSLVVNYPATTRYRDIKKSQWKVALDKSILGCRRKTLASI